MLSLFSGSSLQALFILSLFSPAVTSPDRLLPPPRPRSSPPPSPGKKSLQGWAGGWEHGLQSPRAEQPIPPGMAAHSGVAMGQNGVLVTREWAGQSPGLPGGALLAMLDACSGWFSAGVPAGSCRSKLSAPGQAPGQVLAGSLPPPAPARAAPVTWAGVVQQEGCSQLCDSGGPSRS